MKVTVEKTVEKDVVKKIRTALRDLVLHDCNFAEQSVRIVRGDYREVSGLDELRGMQVLALINDITGC